MATVFVFHGIQGDSQENWFPWLKKELEQKKHRCIVPDFPGSDAPLLDAWLAHFERYIDSVDEHSVFVGHSLGAAFALRLLAHMNQPIHACLLVAPVWEVMNNAFDPLMTTFTVAPYNWENIMSQCSRFSILQSDNDPYIDGRKSEALAKNLHAQMTLVPDAGHFNTAAGYTEFPLLRDLILTELTS